MKHKFPSIKDVANDIRIEANYMKRNYSKEDLADDDGNAGIDVRLQVNGNSWAIHTGDSSFDQDHRGVWGASFIPWGRPNCESIARDLIEQCKDQAAY